MQKEERWSEDRVEVKWEKQKSGESGREPRSFNQDMFDLIEVYPSRPTVDRVNKIASDLKDRFESLNK